MRLFYDNLIDPSTVTVTASSEDAALPATNVQNALRGRVWRTSDSSSTETITFDLGAAGTASAAIIENHNLTASDTSIQVRGSTDNFSSSNVLVGTFTHDAGTMLVTFTGVGYRYWRITFTKSSSSETRDIGRIFIGPYASTTADPDYNGYSLEKQDLSVTQRTIGGQTYSEARSQYNSIRLSFSDVSQADKDAIQTAFETAGLHTSLWIQVKTSGSALTETEYVKFAREPSFDVSAFDSGYLWDIGRLTFETQI